VSSEDYQNGVLILRLNQAVSPTWEEYFRARATRYDGNVSAAIISFQGDRVHIRVNEHFLQQGVNFLKEYILVANEEYAARVKRDHQKEIERRRSELKRKVAEEEARLRILRKVQT
jgi:hypothetical protein